MSAEKFKTWLISSERKKPSTGNAYASAINKIAEHYSSIHLKQVEIYEIVDLNYLDEIISLYELNGKYFEIGERGHGTYRNALKAYRRFRSNTVKMSREKVEVPINHSPPKNEIEKLFDGELIAEAKSMSQYYELFYCIERTIRNLIITVMKENYGANWWEEKMSYEIKKNVEQNMQWEAETGYTKRSENKIDYTTFGELRQIVKLNWNLFSMQFISNTAFNRIMTTLNTLRVPIAHCTPLVEDEIKRLEITVNDWYRNKKN